MAQFLQTGRRGEIWTIGRGDESNSKPAKVFLLSPPSPVKACQSAT